VRCFLFAQKGIQGGNIMAKKSTDIKLSTIKQIAKETNTTEQYTLDNGSTISFYPSFPPLLIKQMLEECQTILSQLGDDIQMSEQDYHNYILFMCIKHFTHLKSQLKADTFVGQINEMESIINAGLFDLIIDDIFLPVEIRKVFDQLAKFGATYQFMEKMTEKMQEEFGRLEIKNADMFKKLSIAQPEDEVVEM
jgi:hypothetical protein